MSVKGRFPLPKGEVCYGLCYTDESSGVAAVERLGGCVRIGNRRIYSPTEGGDAMLEQLVGGRSGRVEAIGGRYGLEDLRSGDILKEDVCAAAIMLA